MGRSVDRASAYNAGGPGFDSWSNPAFFPFLLHIYVRGPKVENAKHSINFLLFDIIKQEIIYCF